MVVFCGVIHRNLSCDRRVDAKNGKTNHVEQKHFVSSHRLWFNRYFRKQCTSSILWDSRIPPLAVCVEQFEKKCSAIDLSWPHFVVTAGRKDEMRVAKVIATATSRIVYEYEPVDFYLRILTQYRVHWTRTLRKVDAHIEEGRP